MGRHANGHRLRSRRYAVGDDFRSLENQCQGTGPKHIHAVLPLRRDYLYEIQHLLGIGDVENQGIILGAPLGGEDFIHRLVV